MDASASSKVDSVNDVYALFFKIENTNFPTPSKQKNTVMKYTKLPDFDYEAKGKWSRNSYCLQPRLRRLISLEEPKMYTSRSLKMKTDPFSEPNGPAKPINRKIVTINEDDEYDLHPKFSSHSKKSSTVIINRAVETESKKEVKSQRSTSRHTSLAKHSKERCAVKMNNLSDKEATPKPTYKNRISNKHSNDSIKSRSASEKGITRKTKSASLSKTSLSKHSIRPSESEQELSLIKAKLNASLNSTLNKKPPETTRGITTVSSTPSVKGKSFFIEMSKKRKLTPVIHVPIEDKSQKRQSATTTAPYWTVNPTAKPTIMVYTKSDGTMDTEIVLHQDVNTSTEPPPETVDRDTDMEGYEPEITYKYVKKTDLHADLINTATFDKLDIPNVSLKTDKIDIKKEMLDHHSKSLPNLQIPPLNITNNRNEKSIFDTHYCKSTSYVISRSTLTYKTQQKINFHIVDSDDSAFSNQLPSQLKYPMNVVSVFKEEMSAKDCGKGITTETQENIKKLKNKSSKKYKNCVNEIKSLNCSYVPNSNKLMKPSDIIRTIRVNNSLLRSVLVCEQFQRELNFIDSFFESLQYLESCSLSEKCFKQSKIEQLVNHPSILDPDLDPKNCEYDKFFSKLENGANSDDSDTMASKNLFLLNILIRDEQRRAKNLLCVLKRREDALKDFTKSQILYLENKKRQDNTDISALKKKQRGALLKLQHECGEMQRMRKALLALSEKRKVALMKTKKDLELKLKNNVNVEQIILGKKKLKRNAVDRTSLPLKCFDLSSSGCEESTTSRSTPECVATVPASTSARPITSAEKSIQTGDSILGAVPTERSTNTTDENYVAVDGGYLNILFHNLTLPQMFSGGKQYEVNEEALKDIVDSSNKQDGENWSDVIEKLLTQSKNDEDDKISTPSTARSLVEEFEQYYRTLAEEDGSDNVSGAASPTKAFPTSEVLVQTSLCKIQENKPCVETMTSVECVEVKDGSCECELPAEDSSPLGLAGPLPVPAGASFQPDPAPLDDVCVSPKSSDSSCTGSSASSQPLCEAPSESASLEPSHAEAEELRRQQLVIEREIKELEEQQCRLLVVREIPDKPPPPYTPPVEARPPQKPRPFRVDDATKERVRAFVLRPETVIIDPADAFDVLIRDFSEETLTKHNSKRSDKPWDSCNLQPQKHAPDTEKLSVNASNELNEVLTPATPSLVSGVSSRRSDHIDDILFAEWRRAEPEWTSLHNEEAQVKNQLFETIFQRILTETVDEYKRTVLAPPKEHPLVL